ncbi:serine hydrolase [Pseudorhodoferax sp. Leaf274]|uniref:serine hydrolase domain-containing protein n=1 Tax=Pseudorhodoferax sp. Leaf274 TaxID=1736318 RepID=UPI00138F239A|nr:serine hydrolase domain-containing protein [Pseudorhodoferax sp. Leaf274]
MPAGQPPSPDFSNARAALRRFVDAQVIPGAAAVIATANRVLEEDVYGWADLEERIPLRHDQIYRVFSNTKLVTTCGLLLLLEKGHCRLDDPVAHYLPAFSRMRVLRKTALSLDDTEAARQPPTLRHLLTHTAGLVYAGTHPGSLLAQAYQRERILDPAIALEESIDRLAALPLLFHPGEGWEYSMATDVLGRVIEVISGARVEDFLQQTVFDPLAMRDSVFRLPPQKLPRLAGLYEPAQPDHPLKGGLTRATELESIYTTNDVRPLISPGGGLFSTTADMLQLLRALLPGEHALLRPESLELLLTSQVPASMVRYPATRPASGKTFSFGGALTVQPSSIEHPLSKGELQWGGIAGTHWWLHPTFKTVGLIMTQRHLGFWHLFSFQYKNLTYRAIEAFLT